MSSTPSSTSITLQQARALRRGRSIWVMSPVTTIREP